MKNFTVALLSFYENEVSYSSQSQTGKNSEHNSITNNRANFFKNISSKKFMRRFYGAFGVLFKSLGGRVLSNLIGFDNSEKFKNYLNLVTGKRIYSNIGKPFILSRSLLGVLVASLTLNSNIANAQCSDLGDAKGFAVFTFGDFKSSNDQVWGRVAVGGNFTVSNWGIGAQNCLTNDPNRNDLIVAGNLSYNSGQVNNGSVRYGGTLISAPTVVVGTIAQGSLGITFSNSEIDLKNKSTFWSGLSQTGTVSNNGFGEITFTGTSSSLNVFNLTAAEVQAFSFLNVNINAPSGSTVLINVSGSLTNMPQTTVSYNGSQISTGTIGSNYQTSPQAFILWNFGSGTTAFTMNQVGFQGSILAPWANVTSSGGEMNGSFVANSIVNNNNSNVVQIHCTTFQGCLPPANPTTCNVLSPTNVSANKSTICLGESAILSATCLTNETAQWYEGNTTTSIGTGAILTYTPNSVGTKIYTVGCRNNTTNCETKDIDRKSVTITVNSVPTQPTISGGDVTICSGTSATLTASACSGGTYLWSNNATTNSITVTVTGTFTVTCTQSSCTSSASAGVSVTVNPIPAAPTNISGGGTFCKTAANSSFPLTATCATNTTPVWYASPSATTTFFIGDTYNVTTTGTFTYYVACRGTTAPNCETIATDRKPVTIAINDTPNAPTVSVEGGSNTVCGTSATLNGACAAGSGLIPTWSNGVTATSIVVTVSGTYTAKCISASPSNCPSPNSANLEVGINSNTSTPTISGGNLSVCKDVATSLTATGCSGTYNWSNGGVGSTISVPTDIVRTITYTVTCTVGSCTSSASAGVSVTVNPAPTQPTISGENLSVCKDVATSLTATGCSGTYNWSNGGVGSTISVPTDIVGTITYTVTCTVGTCTSNPSAGVSVTVNPNPTVTITGATTVCQGGKTTLTVSGIGTYAWSQTPAGFTATTATVEVGAGTYQVMVTNGLCSATGTVTVTENANPTVTITGATTVCQGGKTTLTVSGTGTYAWSQTPAGFTATTATVEVGAGTYQVMVTNGLCSATGTVTITVNSAPTQPTISGGNVTICSGTSATLTASACTDGIYLWSNNATTSSITVTETGIFTVTCTQSSCKSPPSASASVTVSQNLPAPSSVTSNNSCQVVSDNVNEPTLIKLLATCSTGQKPQWFDSAGVLVGTGNSFIASVLVTTTFTVGCKDDQIGCETLPANRKPVVATVIINVKNGGQIEANQSNCGPFIPNKLTNTELPSGGNAPVEYLWLKNLNGDAVYDGDPAKWIPVGLNGEPNTPDYQPELISKTTSFIRCVRSVGCNDFLAETNVVIITINANPTVTITGATTVCQGGKTTLTVSGIGTYAWSQTPAGFTATTATVEVGAGTYQVMLTNGLCSATGTVTVTENANPTGIAATAQNSTCDADIAKNNGSIKLTGFATGLRYDIVEGATYTGTKKYADATDIPANGIVKSGIANPPTNAGTKYTIRVFNGNNCYEDYTVTMQQVVCSCAEVKCMSYGVMKTKSGMK